MNLNDATLRQIDAADPGASTWLSANAGSGKTRVLTDRVARLLLDGVSPQNILCLTYTKAAASEMQNRLFLRLGEWAMKDDPNLKAALAKLGIPTEQINLPQARRLFARAIETPGGLKIQTIHAYCASLLRKFPMEAGVSPQFSEMDDRAARLLRVETTDQLAQEFPEIVAELARFYTGEDFDGLTQEITQNRSEFTKPISRNEVFAWFDVPPSLTEDQVIARAIGPGDNLTLEKLLPLLDPNNRNDGAAINRLRAMLPITSSNQSLILLEKLFLSEKGAGIGRPKKTFPSASVKKGAAKELMPHLEAFMERVADTKPLRAGLVCAEKTLALHAFAQEFIAKYEAAKQHRGWLDFDDLIVKAGDLLTDPAVAAWVLYRLDGGIDHILVDEAQDTSPAQWRVIDNLSREFTSGLGGRDDVERTIFVVGDPKQSIYSFQGADPAEFSRMRDSFDQKLTQIGKSIQQLPMEFSFRSSPAILDFVDFALESHDGLGDSLKHRGIFESLPGRVDLWPVREKVSFKEDRAWFDPVDRRSDEDHRVQLAKEIAQEIRRIIETEPLPDAKGNARRVTAGDFLILLRKRSDLFHEIIRACKREGLPIAGADRLRIGGELAVKDLTALMAFLGTPEDDLSLAAVLRSPIFGWSEDDLFRLAHYRAPKTYLWRALSDNAAAYPETFRILTSLRNEADFLRPFELLERILTRFDGRRKLLARLGHEAEDGIDALLAQALNYEQLETPSLTGFVTWLATEKVTIKRQMDTVDDQIRVMTVHGSKGLESAIVILPDLAVSRSRNQGEVVNLEDGGVAWNPGAGDQTAPISDAQARKKEAREQEQTRLLYVAMTRAEQWLILAAAGDIGKQKTGWCNIVQKAMETVGSTEITDGERVFDRHETGIWPQKSTQLDQTSTNEDAVTLPAWIDQHVENPPSELPTLSPSDLGGAKALFGEVRADFDAEQAKRRGRQLHLLLEHLPHLDPKTWPAHSHRLLASGADFATSEEIDALLKEASTVLNAPELAEIFDPSGLAEVDITAPVADGSGRILSGIIDRLIITEESVLVVDFKSNHVVPETPDQTPEGILRQMGAYRAALGQIYPGRQINCAILWTAHAKLMRLEDAIVDDAFRRLDVSAVGS